MGKCLGVQLRERRVCFEGIVTAGKARAAGTGHMASGSERGIPLASFSFRLGPQPIGQCHSTCKVGLFNPVKLLWKQPDRHTEDCCYGDSKFH